ncbi:hypothetical protein [Paenibacillus sp. YIM B09110]|uniref:hypothetical protein n=1 Tax=Paenibacillus sp. YIM B09110 TaxID=3126102 RepID=UPI00301C67B8
MCSEYRRQQLVETTQAAEDYNAQRIAELHAEVKRLRSNIIALGDFARQRKVIALAGPPFMALYNTGVADAYEVMATAAAQVYGGVFEVKTEESVV